ncbi:hypothetical protein DMR_01540 [Solidesulfovibrio magneticus RS-1]|uniref:Uncharacterized protein n=1 Tax=Solidesulfovibrio magneticus (strain ATCC 700980 / DSM 13731 / RS-1) TaxID=573370 RepID=C4XTY0_SOLM1|nr:hypothetical protein DMR_01540 [Solidesulfovibrio magneticus RS-1]
MSDYFGFQYMRDIDSGDKGHNTSFLTKIADNTLTILSDSQRAQLVALAREQEAGIRQFAEKRFPLIHAFRRNLEGNIPAGSKGLDRDAVKRASADLYELDGALAYGRAKVMGRILCELNAPQRNALARLKFGDSRSWPEVGSPLDKRSMSHVNHVAVMTYASEMFAWHAGSLDADIYFCPERHGMYFGGFGLKTAPAMGKPNFSISTGLTADRGESFLSMLTGTQQKFITDTVNEQRQLLHDIVRIRREIATQLRDFERCGSANWEKVRALSRKYGEIDGEISYLYATTFASIAKTLTNQQKASLSRLRPSNPSDPKGPFLYSEPIPMPRIDNTDFLFGVR